MERRDTMQRAEKINQVCTRLKFLGNIGPGQKINVNSQTLFLQSDDMFSRLSRTWFWPDNRQNTKLFLHTVILDTVDLLKDCNRDDPYERDVFTNIVKDFSAIHIGFANLKKTYENDIDFGCTLDTYMGIVDSKLNEIKSNAEL